MQRRLTPVLTPDNRKPKETSCLLSSKVTRKPSSGKPHPDFPLFRHATGRWAKKVKGKFCYFGKVANDPDGQLALAQWLEQKDDLLAGRTPRVKPDGLPLDELLDRFMVSKRCLLDTCEITPKHYAEQYDESGQRPR